MHAKNAGTMAESDIILGGCDHDMFEFDSGTKQIRLDGTELCLNAEGGVGNGAAIIAWWCSTGGDPVPDNQRFEYDERRLVISPVSDTNLAFNIKEANVAAGTPIILYPIIVSEEM